MLAEHPDINVVYSSWTAKWDATKAQKEAEAALLKNPDIAAFIVSIAVSSFRSLESSSDGQQ